MATDKQTTEPAEPVQPVQPVQPVEQAEPVERSQDAQDTPQDTQDSQGSQLAELKDGAVNTADADPTVTTTATPAAAASPAADAEPPVGKWKALRTQLGAYFQLLVYADPTWKDYLLLIGGLVFAAAGGVPIPLMGILFGELVDDLNQATCDAKPKVGALSADELQHAVNEKVLKLVYIGIASFLLIYIYLVCWAVFSRRLEARIRDRYFQNLLRQDAAFYDKRQAGELSSRLNADIQIIQSGTSEKVGIVIACTSFFLTSYGVGFARDATLAAMLVSLIPAFLILAAVGSGFTQKYTIAMSDAIASASSVAQETLSHIAVVQAFNAGPKLEAKFAAGMRLARKQGVKKAFAAALQAGTLYFIAYSANALAFWQGSRQIADSIKEGGDDVSIGRIYTVIFLLVDACIILGSVSPYLPLIGAAAASFRKLRQDIDSQTAIDSGSDKGDKVPTTTAGGVSFQNVTFAYVARPDRPVLKNVSFECPAGKYTALVGLSGSGKSTVAGLTSRLYDPNQGTVTLDGQDLRNLNVKSLRSYMSLVQQEPSLLNRSILENVALGVLNSPWERHAKFQAVIESPILAEIAAKVRDGADLTATAEKYGADTVELVAMVRHAADLADASGFIEKLENSYGTEVGVGGKLVSGGQRQRIALARALIRDPKILILDEATASLDSASEHRIQQAVESIASDRTLIAIAHRLSTIKNADNIIVMNNGEIIEQGTHSELMTLNGSYAGMVRLQNIEAERQEDGMSVASTARGDIETETAEQDSIAKDKAQYADKASDSVDAKQDKETPEAVADAAHLDSNKSAGTVIARILKMVRPNLLWLMIAIVAGVAVGLTFSASGLIFGHTVGNLSPCNPISKILWAGRFFGGLFFMLAVVELLANSTSWSGFGYVAEKLLYRIRVLTFRALYEQDLDWHQGSGRTPATLLSVITADTAAVGGFSGSIIGTMFSIMVNFFVAIVMSHIIAWKIAIVCLVTVPVLLGSGIMQVRSLSQFERKHAGAYSSAIGITVEAINSFKTVSSLSIEEEVLGTYRRALKAPQKEIVLFSAWTNFWLAMANSTCNLIYAFAYWWGSTRIIKGEYTQTQFLIILVAMLVSAQLWGQMFSLAPEISRAKAAASRILSLVDLGSSKDLKRFDDLEKTDVEAMAEAPRKPSGPTKGSTITFKDVAFSYPARPHIQILKGMSFTIPSGQFCGLVGPSGAGKSTIMSLVQRMYRPTGGTVEIDGVDICAKEGAEFRDDIAVVPQDCALFEGTIKFNVSLGARTSHVPTDAEIEEACRLANIHDTIAALPDGYNTECGPNGSRLSGGQRQRLAIARALVRKPKLLLLDESTSALDAESERALQEGLERAAKGITVIAITHRLHTVRKADIIFVVEGGQVVEKGRHEELVERSESYRVNALQQMLST